jgi:hypothetical protein
MLLYWRELSRLGVALLNCISSAPWGCKFW